MVKIVIYKIQGGEQLKIEKIGPIYSRRKNTTVLQPLMRRHTDTISLTFTYSRRFPFGLVLVDCAMFSRHPRRHALCADLKTITYLLCLIGVAQS